MATNDAMTTASQMPAASRERQQGQRPEEDREQRRIEVGRVVVDVLTGRVERQAVVQPCGGVVVGPGVGQRIRREMVEEEGDPTQSSDDREGEDEEAQRMPVRTRWVSHDRGARLIGTVILPTPDGRWVADRGEKRHQHVAEQAGRRQDGKGHGGSPPPASCGPGAGRSLRRRARERPTRAARTHNGDRFRTSPTCQSVSVPKKSSVARGSSTSWRRSRPRPTRSEEPERSPLPPADPPQSDEGREELHVGTRARSPTARRLPSRSVTGTCACPIASRPGDRRRQQASDDPCLPAPDRPATRSWR